MEALMKKILHEQKKLIGVIVFVLVLGGVCLVRSGAVPIRGNSVQQSTSLANGATIIKDARNGIDQQSEKTGLNSASRESSITVYLCGAVKNPGLYTLPSSARVGDALALAGGFRKSAAQEALNLAKKLKDGEQLYFLTKKEFHAQKQSRLGSQATANGDQKNRTMNESGQDVNMTSSAQKGKINLNTATQAELETLSGIGPVTAQKIFAYREEKGPFSSFEDLKNISGIGDKRVESLKAEATVQ